jgi:hypothetical protein
MELRGFCDTSQGSLQIGTAARGSRVRGGRADEGACGVVSVIADHVNNDLEGNPSASVLKAIRSSLLDSVLVL